jgi:hypothetical protein
MGVVPEALLRRPLLSVWAEPYMEAFLLLAHSRPHGMSGPGYLPLSEIMACLDLLQVTDPMDRLDYLRRIQDLDTAYMEEVERKRQAEEARVKAQQPARRR